MSSYLILAVVLALVASTTTGVAAVPPTGAWQGAMRCTGHNFVGLAEEQGTAILDQTLSCGARYRELNLGFVTAMQGMGGAMCNQCLEIKSEATGRSTFVLALDVKGSAGFDVAEGAWKALGHSAQSTSNPLYPSNPQNCNWRVVDPSNCAGFCVSTHPDVVCKRGCQSVIDSKTFDLAVPSVQNQVRGLCNGPVLPGSSTPFCTYNGQSVNCNYITSVNSGSPFSAAGPNWFTSAPAAAPVAAAQSPPPPPPPPSAKPPSPPSAKPPSPPAAKPPSPPAAKPPSPPAAKPPSPPAAKPPSPAAKPPSPPPSSSTACVGAIKNGAACRSGVDQSTCSGVYYAMCVNNKWLLRSCGSGSACRTFANSFTCMAASHQCPML